jgi:mono/diheme cytochrome c family protein
MNHRPKSSSGCDLLLAHRAAGWHLDRVVALATIGLVSFGCGTGGRHQEKLNTPMLPVADSSTQIPTTIDTNPAAIQAEMLALGDSIFHGKVAMGTCMLCHGADAKGTQLAPDLTDAIWLNGDGSFRFIMTTIITGVPAPKAHPEPMPPMGGASFTPAQVEAVAAYVYSRSRPGGGR